jgi:murein DD-endopeptidase MepM/ murein hydrolase activator NlpD
MLSTWLKICFFIFLASCSHMKSGQHVFWSQGTDLEEIARSQGVSAQEIKKLNPNARQGAWLFVPNKIGIFQDLNETVAVNDYSSLGSGDYAWPVPSIRKISSGFGNRWGRKHEGIDIPAPIGTIVVSVREGVVKYSDSKISGYGKMIVIEHPGKVFSVYAHLSQLKVRAGDRVKKGQVIAKSGNTGRSTGPHLHFEIRIKNQARDPARYLGMSK